MNIEIIEHKRVSVVAIDGRIDGSTASEFEVAVNATAQGENKNLILDLSNVDFLASAGLRVLVNSQKAINSKGGKMVLAAPSQQVVDTLDIAGLDVLFDVFEDRESAVGSF